MRPLLLSALGAGAVATTLPIEVRPFMDEGGG